MDSRYFSLKLAEWYQLHKRTLPWRETKNPYHIWLSEIILQQTRVNQGLPYYKKFIEAFPTVFDLAKAPQQKVLRLWQGLGYYTRARNLHLCAKVVVTKNYGKFPETFEELKQLPGIGDYTAAAIASIAFGKQVAVVDGNVSRVLSRIYGVETAINSPQGKKVFFDLANNVISSTRQPDVHNQAMMEFGALHCTPQNPRCDDCIFATKCFANRNSLQKALPVKNRINKIRKRYFYYFAIQKGKSLLLKKRDEKDIWHGLYDFYLVEKKRSTDIEKIMGESEMLKKVKGKKIVNVTGVYKHVLSHQVIYSRFTQISIAVTPVVNGSGLKLYPLKKVAELPKPVLISRFLADYEYL